MSTINFDLLAELVDEQLNLNAGAVEESLVEGLRAVTVPVENVDVSMVPARLRELFTFKNEFGLSAARRFDAKSVALGVFAVRLDENGNMMKAAPSIQGAHHSAEGKFIPGGEWGTGCTVMPDLYIEAEFHGDGEIVVPVPVIMKEPYPVKNGNVNLSLSTANKSLTNWQDYHNAARQMFVESVQAIAKELSIPAGEQFLVCFFGFPEMSKEYSGGNDTAPFWRAAFNGGYLLGGRRVGSSKLSNALSGLRVKPTMKIGGKSLSDRLAAEMMKAKKGGGLPVAAPNVRTMPAPVAKSEPQAVTTPALATVVAQATTASAMPSAGILAKLQKLESMQEPDTEWQLVEDEPTPDVEDVEEIVVTMPVKRANPFA